MTEYTISVVFGFIMAAWGCAPTADATAYESRQSVPTTAPRRTTEVAPVRPDDGELTPDQQEELKGYVEIIASDEKGFEFRRFAAEGLLKSQLPNRVEAVIALLSTNGSSGKVMAICGAISSLGAGRDDRLDDRMVPPLVALLRHENAAVAAAAASALSEFRSPEVARSLGEIARSEGSPLAMRTAAVDALAPSTNRREVVGELISLLDSANPTIVEHAIRALTPASRFDFGSDVRRWQSWWKEKEALTTEEWLQNRLELAIDQQQALRRHMQDVQIESEKRDREIARRFGDDLRLIDQLIPQPASKEAKRQTWLDDPLADIRLAALGLLRDQIVTAGDPLSPSLRETVRRLFGDPVPAVRIAAYEIIGHLKDPADAVSVLEALRTEQGAAVRETMLRVLGRLENLASIPALIAELSAPATPGGCIREAARSLGMLGGRGKAPIEVIEPSFAPLLRRFHEAPADDTQLREALLGAMAMIADPSFVEAFIAHLSSDSPEILLAAIRGIKAVSVRDRIDAVLIHLSHADPRVRQVAAEAVGFLGEEQHLEALLNRMAPGVEGTAGVRDAAFDAFRDIVLRTPAAARLKWADRLSLLPERRIQLLTALVDSWATANAHSQELTSARERLVEAYMAQEKYTDAIPHLERLHATMRAIDPARAGAVGLTLAKAALRSRRADGGIDLISNVAAATDEKDKAALVDAIFEHLAATVASGEGGSASARQLIERLRTIPGDSLGGDWQPRLDAFERGLREPGTTPGGGSDQEP